MSQQPLFVPAAPGWYIRPGDPPDVTRHWDGKQWLCEVKGPVRDRFDDLRARSFQGLSPDDQSVLRQLTAEVSRVEDLVLATPSANPPLVEVAPPAPYTPPSIDPYTFVPIPGHGQAGRSVAAVSRRRGARVVVTVVVVVLVVVAVVVGLLLSGVVHLG
ncbi:MAG: hypothetical protein HY829_04050 [Actinobacteria bacterium]|nr:hypothetical protein [Actinomycetota bacterium]